MQWTKSSKCDSNHCLEVGTFQRSTHCNDSSCLEVGAFRKSSRSNGASGQCVEAGMFAPEFKVGVRDSKLLDRETGTYHGPILWFDKEDWAKFINSDLIRA